MADTEPKLVEIQESKAEKLTRQYNEFLTKTESLDHDPSVSVDEYTTQNGKKIKRYNLAGTEFALLSHTVGLEIKNDNLEVSKNIGQEISHWDNKKKGEANNQISCSLITHNHIAHATTGLSEPQVMLGFSHLENDELLFALANDGGTMVDKKLVVTKMDEYNTHPPQEILKTGGYGNMYNEVLVTRYQQNEQTRKPDYIITFNGEINSRVEQAIDYFNIPIINFQTSEYVKKINQQIGEVLTKIGQSSSLTNKKDLFNEIPYLNTNRENWRTTVKDWVYDKDFEAQLKQQIHQAEESIVDLQLNHDKDMAAQAVENLKAQMSPEAMQILRQTFLELTHNVYSGEQIFLYNTKTEIRNKWFQTSHKTLLESLSKAAPDIIEFYQKQTAHFSSGSDSMDIKHIQSQLENFQKYALVTVINNQPLLRSQTTRDDMGLSITEDPINYLNKNGYPEISNLLNQIFSAQKQLETTLSSGLKQAKAREKQNQIDAQNTILENVSSNTAEMINLLKVNSWDLDYRQRIIKKIDEHLNDDSRSKIDIIKDLRENYESLQDLSVNNIYYNSIYRLADGDIYKSEIFKILANPNTIQEMPKIKISETLSTASSLGFNQKSKVINFTNPNGQELILKVYENNQLSHVLEHSDNDSVKTKIENINKKWFWRLRHNLPKLEQTNTYQLNPADINSPLLIKNKDKWYLVHDSTVQKISMTNFDI